jgi:hydrogenase maturation protein HypF
MFEIGASSGLSSGTAVSAQPMAARSIHVRGVVQGVGFRPFVYRLAKTKGLCGWVLNTASGAEVHVEGADHALHSFVADLRSEAPPASVIADIAIRDVAVVGAESFTIRSSRHGAASARISPDLPVCENCLRELFDPQDRRYGYPYINCTDCGPRYSIVERLPYDRVATTMKAWPLDAACAREFEDPGNRRFHAQPTACAACGPGYVLVFEGQRTDGEAGMRRAAQLLCDGRIVAVKGLGGYHLACNAMDAAAVSELRQRKFRKEQPFAVMTRDAGTARRLVEMSEEAEKMLASTPRPIVVATAKFDLPGVAPGMRELGVMLPYAPVHHLLFAHGAPDVLVMTSGNRSSEPIAYEDDDARERLRGIADSFLTGGRPIARRVDDSVMRVGPFGPMILRRSRGFAPGAVTQLPASAPVLAVGADLKNTVTLAVEGQAFVSQHIGDLSHYSCRQAFLQTVEDLLAMYEVDREAVVIAHDRHPQYASTIEALALPAARHYSLQHHRAHVASVLAERQAWEQHVVGVSFDGTGFGDDGSIWGGEFFAGSMIEGFWRAMHLRPAWLPGGDAAARAPVQSAAGFLHGLDQRVDLQAAPFHFPDRFERAARLLRSGARPFTTTSAGRLFDAAAALLGFTREVTFEGQAAIWLEQMAKQSDGHEAYPFPVEGDTLDYGPLLLRVIEDRRKGRDVAAIARAFHRGVATGIAAATRKICEQEATDVCVLSGGVFQNQLLLCDLRNLFVGSGIRVWTNSLVPPNDGGISLGQAALAVFEDRGARYA